MSFNLCNLPREQKYQIQLDYEASFWAYQIKRGKKRVSKCTTLCIVVLLQSKVF